MSEKPEDQLIEQPADEKPIDEKPTDEKPVEETLVIEPSVDEKPVDGPIEEQAAEPPAKELLGGTPDQFILKKISELEEITDTDAADSLVIVDASEGDATKRTKKTRMDKLKVTKANQVGTGVVTNASLAANAVNTANIKDGAVTKAKMAAGSVGNTQLEDSAVTVNKIGTGAVTEGKIADSAVTLPKTKGQRVILAPKLFGSDDVVMVREFNNEFAITSVHNGWKIVGLKASLSQVSSSGSVTTVVKYTPPGDTAVTVGTVSLAANVLVSSQVNVNRLVAESGRISFSVTSAGNNAKGLIVYLILEKQ